MTFISNNLSTHARHTATACIATTLAAPVVAALFSPAAPVMVAVAVAMPFITMTVLESELSNEQGTRHSQI